MDDITKTLTGPFGSATPEELENIKELARQEERRGVQRLMQMDPAKMGQAEYESTLFPRRAAHEMHAASSVGQEEAALRDIARNSRQATADAERTAAVRARFNSPGHIDPALLAEEGVKDINVGKFRGLNKMMGKIAPVAKALAPAAKIGLKALPVIGLGAEIASTPEIGAGSDIVPGRPSFDQLYPKQEALRKLAGKQEEDERD